MPEARTILAFMTRDAARDVRRVLDSAAANAEANHGLDSDDLYVVSAFVGAGPTLKRWKARARGRVGRIKKRTCHITIALAPPAGEAIPAPIERPAPVTLTEEPEPIVVDDATGEVVEGEAAVEERPPRRLRPRRSRSARALRARRPPRPRRDRRPRRRGGGRGGAQAEAHARREAEGRGGDRGARARSRAEAKPKTTRKKKTETTESDEGSEG